MSKKNQKQHTGLTSLQTLLDGASGKPIINPETRRIEAPEQPKPEPKTAYIGKIEMRYLDMALDKLSQPLHPNFVRAASASTLQVYRRMQGALAIADASKPANSKLVAIAVAKSLHDDARCYVTFWTTLMSNVAFAGHMDTLAIERSLNPEAVDDALDAMDELHPTEPGDEPAFDRSLKEDHARRASDGSMEVQRPETVASSFDEIYEAMQSIQSWIDLAFIGFTPNQIDYWQCSPVPFCKRGADDDYAPITDFDEYREFQTQQWRTKQKVVKTDDSLALMEAA